MRRLQTLQRSIDRAGRRSAVRVTSPYLYSTCEVRAAFSTSAPVRADDSSFTDKIRRRIWGTDAPPGAQDPYGGPSILEQARGKKAGSTETTTKKATPIDPNYDPADTWDGLEVVGEALPETADDIFVGFATPDKVTDTAELTAALHRAIVETAALLQAGKPVSELGQAGVETDITSDIHIVADGAGIKLDFGKSDVTLEGILESLQPREVSEVVDEQWVDEAEVTESAAEADAAEAVTAEEVFAEEAEVDYQEVVAKWDPAWLKLSLQNPETKFYVLKRLTQLTGQRVKDSSLRAIKTPQNVLNQITIQPKPKKLAEILAQRAELVSLPNVRIVDRRITPIDKEKQIGRWKVIEEALQKRGLPVTGHE